MLRSGLGQPPTGRPCRTLTATRQNRLSALLLRRPVLVTSLVHSVDPPYAE